MTLADYKSNMRVNRGKLKYMDEDLATLYMYGSERLKDWALHNKFIGIKKLATLAEGASEEAQDNFVSWMCDGRRTIGEINVKMLEVL